MRHCGYGQGWVEVLPKLFSDTNVKIHVLDDRDQVACLLMYGAFQEDCELVDLVNIYH